MVGEINSLNGVIDMLLAGMGISVLPRHCVARLLEKKKLFEFTMSKPGPLLAQIYIVTLVETSRPRKSQVVIDAFLQMKKAE